MPVGPMGGLPRAPRGSHCKLGTTFQQSYSHNDMVDNFIVIQLTFADLFVPQDFTLRTTQSFYMGHTRQEIKRLKWWYFLL